MAKYNNSESKAVERNIKSVSKKVKTLLARADHNDVLARYEVSVILKNVMADAKYGENAIAKMQSEIGLKKQSLYRIARVAQAWPEVEFSELANRVNKNEWPLSWSHFELLASIDESRNQMVERALAESLTVAELAAAIKPTASVLVAEGMPPMKPEPQLAAELERWVEDFEQKTVTWGDRLRVDAEIAMKDMDEAGIENFRATASRLKKDAMYLIAVAESLERVLEGTPNRQAQVHQLMSTP